MRRVTFTSSGETERPAKLEAAYDHIRTWCEIVVEAELFANVTRRYQPNVSMTNPDRVKPERVQAAIDVILPIFERASLAIRSVETETYDGH